MSAAVTSTLVIGSALTASQSSGVGDAARVASLGHETHLADRLARIASPRFASVEGQINLYAQGQARRPERAPEHKIEHRHQHFRQRRRSECFGPFKAGLN